MYYLWKLILIFNTSYLVITCIPLLSRLERVTLLMCTYYISCMILKCNNLNGKLSCRIDYPPQIEMLNETNLEMEVISIAKLRKTIIHHACSIKFSIKAFSIPGNKCFNFTCIFNFLDVCKTSEVDEPLTLDITIWRFYF
jgi:hypothetical protein